MIVRTILFAIMLTSVGGVHAASAGVDLTGKVLTVLGPIAPEDVGVTLPHEHVFIHLALPVDDVAGWEIEGLKRPQSKDELRSWRLPVSLADRAYILRHLWYNEDAQILDNMEDAIREVTYFKHAGGNTIVDVTNIGINRSPQKLAEVSRRSGLNIVMGSGWYRRAWHPPGHELRTVESLTNEIVRDIVVGVDGTGIRSGIIGEVSAMDIQTDPVDSIEVKGLRAAARASQITGAAITIHQWIRDGAALLKTLEIIEEEGGDLNRVVVGHIDAISVQKMAFLKSIMDRGVTLEFDLLGTPYFIDAPKFDDRPMADAVVVLVKEGYGDRLLISQDVCTKVQTKTYGGKGYDYILTSVVPYLKSQGLSDADIRTIMVENPNRILTFVAPGSVSSSVSSSAPSLSAQ